MIAPLDWGLGHATRCIPIINELLLLDCEVIIAADNLTSKLLQKEFPQLTFLPLLGYRIKVSSKKKLYWKIIGQFPKIMYVVFHEKRWLKKIIEQYKVNVIISDNRVGLYNPTIVSVYITHQLLIKTGNKFTSSIAQRIHNHFINKYNQCWVPDFENEGLAGELSHPIFAPKNVQYIGALSRFEKIKSIKKKYDLVIILSGPEPQRTIFEKILLADLLSYQGKTLLIRGLPGSKEPLPFKKHSVEMINHLSSQKLSEAIQQAAIVISRSGYSTVMDLVKLNQKAILVPTPGQAEQEYLAGYLKEKRMFFSTGQDKFNLSQALHNFLEFNSAIPVFNMEQYKLVVEKLARPRTKLTENRDKPFSK